MLSLHTLCSVDQHHPAVVGSVAATVVDSVASAFVDMLIYMLTPRSSNEKAIDLATRKQQESNKKATRKQQESNKKATKNATGKQQLKHLREVDRRRLLNRDGR